MVTRAGVQFAVQGGVTEARVLAAEICARVAEQAFYDIDAPPARLCGAEVPIPYPKHLEDAAVPQPPAIVAAAREVMGRRG